MCLGELSKPVVDLKFLFQINIPWEMPNKAISLLDGHPCTVQPSTVGVECDCLGDGAMSARLETHGGGPQVAAGDPL